MWGHARDGYTDEDIQRRRQGKAVAEEGTSAPRRALGPLPDDAGDSPAGGRFGSRAFPDDGPSPTSPASVGSGRGGRFALSPMSPESPGDPLDVDSSTPVPPPVPVLPDSEAGLAPSAGRRYSASMEPGEVVHAAPRRSAATATSPASALEPHLPPVVRPTAPPPVTVQAPTAQAPALQAAVQAPAAEAPTPSPAPARRGEGRGRRPCAPCAARDVHAAVRVEPHAVQRLPAVGGDRPDSAGRRTDPHAAGRAPRVLRAELLRPLPAHACSRFGSADRPGDQAGQGTETATRSPREEGQGTEGPRTQAGHRCGRGAGGHCPRLPRQPARRRDAVRGRP